MKKRTYSEAIAQLEEIVRQIDNNELEIDELAEKIKDFEDIIDTLNLYINEFV